MPVNIEKDDLRSVKTEKALDISMLSLLRIRNFRKITVKDICDGASVSRATFYTHFTDKYDFLKNWLVYLKPENLSKDEPYEKIEKAVNQVILGNEKIIKNIVYEANNETLRVLFDFILSCSDLIMKRNSNGKTDPKSAVLSNFYAGGLLNYFLWQIENKFPSDVPSMNIYLYELIKKLQEWKE